MVAFFKWEYKVFSWLNQLVYNRFVRNTMLCITQMGSGIFVTMICVVALLSNWYGIVFSVLLTQLVVQTLKRLVRRTRPYVSHEKIMPIHPPKCQYSFPSGHTASALTLALGLTYYLPHFAPVFLTLACLVAISRMVLGVHYPTDVVAGMIIATVSFTIRLWVL